MRRGRPVGSAADAAFMEIKAVGQEEHGAESDALPQLQRQCLRELTSLRAQLGETEQEKELLQRKIKVLTAHLIDTTQELEQRTALYSEASDRAEQLEARVADAKKALLTREMRIHELAQQNKTLEMTLRKEEQAKEHWEREYVAARDEAARAARAADKVQETSEDRAVEINAWKGKLQVAIRSVRDLTEELDAKREREAQLMTAVAKLQSAAGESDKRWKSKLGKRDKAIAALEQRLKPLVEMHEQICGRSQEITEQEALWRSEEATQQLEKRRQLLALQDQLQRASGDVDKAKMSEMLLQRELCRLREELLLSESQRKTEQRRHEQQLKGKDKEMAFIWQKYVEAVAAKGDVSYPSARRP